MTTPSIWLDVNVLVGTVTWHFVPVEQEVKRLVIPMPVVEPSLKAIWSSGATDEYNVISRELTLAVLIAVFKWIYKAGHWPVLVGYVVWRDWRPDHGFLAMARLTPQDQF